MLDPKAQKREATEHAFRIAKACEQRVEGEITDKVMELDVRKEIAVIYVKQLSGVPLTEPEITMLAYFKAGLLA